MRQRVRLASYYWLTLPIWLTLGSVWLGTCFSQEVVQATNSAQDPSQRSMEDRAKLLVDNLSSQEYSVREIAVSAILGVSAEAEKPVIQKLESAIRDGDAELQKRGLEILAKLAVDDERSPSVRESAFAALRSLGGAKNDTLARRASQAGYFVILFRQQRVAMKFERLNASVRYSYALGNEIPVAESISIGKDFRGTYDDLLEIRNLIGLITVSFDNPMVNDEVFKCFRNHFSLRSLRVRKAAITDQAVNELQQTPTLRTLEILYCPVDFRQATESDFFKQLTSLRLIGTKIGADDAAFLVSEFSGELDIRKGAYLGIRYSRSKMECILTAVTKDSGAKKAGLLPGDQIIGFNEVQIKEYPELTLELRKRQVGDQAKIRVLRDSEEIEFEVTFGEWPLDIGR